MPHRPALDAASEEKSPALFLAAFSSLKAVWERIGKQREINDFPGAGGRAER